MAFTTFSFFLAGLAAASIPVTLHLLMRGKPKKIEFPALMFVKKKLEIHQRKNRLKHLILLTLRILVLVLFGLVLARPTIKLADWFPSLVTASRDEPGRRDFVSRLALAVASQDAPIGAAVVVDCSIRMEYIRENQSRLELAREFGTWILDQLPDKSDIAVLSTHHETPVFQVDQLAAKERIKRLQAAPLGRTVADAVRDALVLLGESKKEQHELYIITDLSEPGWPTDLGSTIQNLIEGMKSGGGLFGASARELGVFIVDVGVAEPVNTSVVHLALSSDTVAAQAPIRIDLELSHLGPEIRKTVEMVLANREGEETIRSSKTIDFPAGSSRRVASFSLSGFETGTHQGRFRFSVPDALPIDDQAWFTIQVQPPWKLLILSSPPVRDSSLYLRHSLETVPFDVETAPLSQLAGMTQRELEKYRAVFLLDPPAQDPVVWKKLSDYAATGHGVGVFLGPNVDRLDSFNHPSATELLGAKLVRQARDLEGETWIMPGNDASPVFSPFRSYGELSSFPWEIQTVFRYWEVSDLSPRAETVALFSDGRPAILSQSIGRGQAVTALTPMSQLPEEGRPWNLLPRSEGRWMFLLLSEGIARYLIGVGDQKFNFIAGEQVSIRPNIEDFPATCLMGTPSGQSVRLTPDTVQRRISVPSAVEPGNYRIRSGGARESLDTGFSINSPPEITDLRRVGKERLDQVLGDKNYKLVTTPQEIEIGIARRRVGQEIYPMILLLLVVAFAGEYVFSNFFYGFRPEEGTKSVESDT